MKRKDKLPELLAPAGSFDALIAAVEAGADAVYVGGKRFGARAYAKNFDIEELSRAVSYCRLHSVKLYVTVNTLILDLEMRELVEYAAELWRIGVDALIIADLGAAFEIKKYVPDLELHASTQMSVHNSYGADEAYNMGMSRVVLARELPLSDIEKITKKCKPEIEVFLHGALCVCHSGQCLFSSMVGGRSGNRGECAQPCRLPYNGGKYPLSLRDLSLAGHIKELVDSGVSSLKIEGRMKSPSYVYTVTNIYRRLLDEYRNADAEEHSSLRRAFSRGGFTDGYFNGTPERVELGMRTDTDKENSRSAEREFSLTKIPVKAEVKITAGEPSEMKLISGERCVRVFGDTPAPAATAPLTEADVRTRLSKMGNTYLSLSQDDISLTLGEGLNLSPSALNALRRAAAAEFENFGREAVNVNYILPKPANSKDFSTAVFMCDAPLPKELSPAFRFDAVFASLMREDLPSYINGVYLPPVIFEHEISEIDERLARLGCGIEYAMVSNIGHIALAEKHGLRVIFDFRLNVTNRVSKAVLFARGCEHIILSPEITLPQARDIGGGVTVYGRIPLMITERCFMRDMADCNKCGRLSLTDRRGEKFPMLREFKHRNIILNSAVTYMGDKRAELSKNRIASYHFIFSNEREDDIENILRSFARGLPLDVKNIRRVGKR